MSEVTTEIIAKDDGLDMLYKMIDLGREGQNIGISTQIPKLDATIAGVQRSTQYLVSGDTGSGKTSFCLYSLIYAPLKDRLGDDSLRIIYYSLEMSKEMLLTKMLSIHIFEKYGVQLGYNDILSRTATLQDEHYELIVAEREWLRKIMGHLVIYDKILTPNTMYRHLKAYSKKHGVYHENADKTQETYIPNVPNQYVLVILDHVWLLRPNNGQDKKQAADLAADYLTTFKNKCGYTPVVLQQLNRQAGSMDRRKASMQLPEIQDLKGTGGVAEASDVVLALFNPARQKVAEWSGYDISRLRDKFRAIVVLKNRYGDPDVAVPVNFFGKVNIFMQMPEAEEVGRNMQKYMSIESRYEEIEIGDVSITKDEKPETGGIDLSGMMSAFENEEQTLTL